MYNRYRIIIQSDSHNTAHNAGIKSVDAMKEYRKQIMSSFSYDESKPKY